MDTIKEKVAYLNGLAEGLDINQDSKEGKLLLAILGVIGDIAEDVEILNDSYDDLDSYLEAVDEDLAALEDEIYGDDEYDYEDDGFIDIECPNCHETVYLDQDMFEDEEQEEVICPNCDTPIALDCDCDCGCDCGSNDCNC